MKKVSKEKFCRKRENYEIILRYKQREIETKENERGKCGNRENLNLSDNWMESQRIKSRTIFILLSNS